MQKKEFKNMFKEIVLESGFRFEFGGYYKQTNECIIVIDLQKSNYGNYYQIMLRFFIQGIFGKTYKLDKFLVKNDTGDVFRGAPNEYNRILDLDNEIDDQFRASKLKELFTQFIIPIVKIGERRDGLYKLGEAGDVYLLPAVKQELEKMKGN